MTRYFLLFAFLLSAVAVGCSDDPSARYADDPQASEAGEATTPIDEMISDDDAANDAAMDKYAAEQAAKAQ